MSFSGIRILILCLCLPCVTTGSQPGYIDITCNQDNVKIYVNESLVGQSPLPILKYGAGRYIIRAEKANYESFTREINLVSGGVVKVQIILKESGGWKETKLIPEEVETGRGNVTIGTTRRGISAVLDGKALQELPTRLEGVPAGLRSLELRYSGSKYVFQFRLKSDQNLFLDADSLLASSLGPVPDMEFVTIPAGTFWMGSDYGCTWNRPRHKVSISSFEIMTTEVTQRMWTQLMNSDPPTIWKPEVAPRGDDLPVEGASWTQAVAFIKKLNQRDAERNYRLPSEAEWEYACRANSETAFCNGVLESFFAKVDQESELAVRERIVPSYLYKKESNCKELDVVGWYSANTHKDSYVMPVKSKLPNAFGLYDMHGNVFEWCEDSWHDGYSGAPVDGRAWIAPGEERKILRGGGRFSRSSGCTSYQRRKMAESDSDMACGFRVVRDRK